jgi:hypothetical protein
MGNCCNVADDKSKELDPIKTVQTHHSQSSIGGASLDIEKKVLDPQHFKPRIDILAMVDKYKMPTPPKGTYQGSENPVKEIKKEEFQYIGQVNEKGNYDGFGQLVANNAMHVGLFRDGKKVGLAKTFLSQNRYILANWQENEVHGKCTYEDNDLGHRSTIEYQNGLKEGVGEEVWSDGTVFRGKYHNDLKEGPGEMIWADGNSFKGEFHKGFIEGKGKYVWSDGKSYEGEWKQDKMHGKGTFSWPDGRKYVGSYVEDQKDGFGIFYWSETKRYEGQWSKGKQHGLGKFYDDSGVCREGIWNNGVYQASAK